jgi:uncharacterized cofD-like protein
MKNSSSNWLGRVRKTIRHEMRWLTPGLGVKRWILLTLAGITFLAIGLAIFILNYYRTAPESWWLPLISAMSLRFLPRILRVLIFSGIGLAIVLAGVWGLNRALLRPFVKPGSLKVETVSAYRKREKGPRIVAIGGGTGLSSVLRGLKSHTNNLTAVVTVADDGGSSGELRKSIGILPPGDIRNCLSALASDEALLTQIFQYRFAAGAGLNGHSLGNLFITALTDLTGSFEEAIAESGRVLAVQGRVLPSTLHDVRLAAYVQPKEENLKEKIKITGESEITKAGGHVARVWLEPDNPLAFPPSIQAILSADLILIGPGSLFTSILPNLLVPDLLEAVRASRGLKFYIVNLATQPGETDGFSTLDHVKTLEKYIHGRMFDLIICNNNFNLNLPAGYNWVLHDQELEGEYLVYNADIADSQHPGHHDSNKLAQVVMDLYNERTGPHNLNIKEEV